VKPFTDDRKKKKKPLGKFTDEKVGREHRKEMGNLEDGQKNEIFQLKKERGKKTELNANSKGGGRKTLKKIRAKMFYLQIFGRKFIKSWEGERVKLLLNDREAVFRAAAPRVAQ